MRDKRVRNEGEELEGSGGTQTPGVHAQWARGPISTLVINFQSFIEG